MGTSGCHTECLYGSSFPPKHNTCKSSLNLWIGQNNPVEMTEFLLQACWVLHCFAQVKMFCLMSVIEGTINVYFYCVFQKKIYKDQAENMLVNHVFNEFASEHGYLRARVSSC